MSQSAYQSAPKSSQSSAPQSAPQHQDDIKIVEATKPKIPIQENRRLARRILALAIAVSLLVFAPLKLGSYRRSVERVFKNGVTTVYVDSVEQHITDAAAAATDLLNATTAKYGETDETRALASLLERLGKASDTTEKYEFYTQMYAAANAVFNQYKARFEADGSMLSKADKVYRDKDDLDGANTQINNNEYWSKAEKYNAARGGFPTTLIGGLFGIDYLPER